MYKEFSCVIYSPTFDVIYPVWNDKLWPGRKSKIESRSSLYWNPSSWYEWGNVSLTKNKDLIWQFEPTFYCAQARNEIIAVNSGFRTDNDIYRSRGLWVDPKYRGRGLSTILLERTVDQARREKCKYIWTMPRKNAVPAYEKVGIKQIGNKWFDEQVEFGPNCLSVLKL